MLQWSNNKNCCVPLYDGVTKTKIHFDVSCCLGIPFLRFYPFSKLVLAPVNSLLCATTVWENYFRGKLLSVQTQNSIVCFFAFDFPLTGCKTALAHENKNCLVSSDSCVKMPLPCSSSILTDFSQMSNVHEILALLYTFQLCGSVYMESTYATFDFARFNLCSLKLPFLQVSFEFCCLINPTFLMMGFPC